jgi:hypothetical protein
VGFQNGMFLKCLSSFHGYLLIHFPTGSKNNLNHKSTLWRLAGARSDTDTFSMTRRFSIVLQLRHITNFSIDSVELSKEITDTLHKLYVKDSLTQLYSKIVLFHIY